LYTGVFSLPSVKTPETLAFWAKTEKENKDKIAIKSEVFGINSFCFYFIIL
jgi:hypothetical protein